MRLRAQRGRFLSLAAIVLAAFPLTTHFSSQAQAGSQENFQTRETSLRAFAAVASVLTSPRCINCHVPGDGPLQGDDSHLHAMNVRRGADGKGSPALHCFACHQTENVAALHGPPGAANWQLPPTKTPMAWKGLSTAEICGALKDPSKNGNRTLQDLIPHMETSLVRWAWNPGTGRTLPPLSHEDFVSRLKEWIDTGAACPE